MSTEIIVVSGFLGAGKTTLIQKLLKEALQNEQVVLIENDFGEVSVDAALMKSSGVEVKEINSGCICCSLSGDFVRSLKEILERFKPDKIIIEPSGVGKLSDVLKACKAPSIVSSVKVESKLTVVDAKRCRMYLDNFGEFFEDQIINADVILLNRIGDSSTKIDETVNLIKELNPDSRILATPLEKLNVSELFSNAHLESREKNNVVPKLDNVSEKHHQDKHNHSAKDIFKTITIRTSRIFNQLELKELFSALENGKFGKVVRAKGIVRGEKGFLNVQYVPGDLKITKCLSEGNMLSVIGSELNLKGISKHFNGECAN